MKISEEGRIELEKIHSMCRMMEMELKLYDQEFDYNDLFDGFETPENFTILLYNNILPIGSINSSGIECVSMSNPSEVQIEQLALLNKPLVLTFTSYSVPTNIGLLNHLMNVMIIDSTSSYLPILSSSKILSRSIANLYNIMIKTFSEISIYLTYEIFQ